MTAYPQLRQTVIDATDVRRTAEFYRELFGLQYRPGDEPRADEGPADWLVLRHRDGSGALAFQRVDRLEQTTWPDPDVPMQLHLDCTVPDLDELWRQRARAEALGASLLMDQSDDAEEPLFVMADPEGHPFCLFVSV
ncbi:VOC family protein [Aeromicrobium duanguangcaii]|uniref:VOC family protein n=1 Tax=Aeromicrobium duanguangcaii TaxID=2968086 RepID=A0ABY5KD95_9ACTN|nr:VOC family protein [Aeromicrobium duanguangcaii]MCD9154741.1 VOC family protein [Aeromicrobium duanguangcaii]MCL3838863.1 VOC family protein [Aeromicrobium duanguangcaii]UUI67845.1 VOC family protein [Aeromicrobium duanguangcaii]